MKVVLIVIGCLVALVVVFIVWRYIATIAGASRRDQALLSAIEPVLSAVRSGATVATDQLIDLARRPDTRSILFRALHELNQSGLIPEEYRSLRSIAESDLVGWLVHPNELGAVPDEIELLKEIEREEGDPPEKYRFFVFKFRTKPPHWAAKDGWTAGVAGPYWDGEPPLHMPAGVFSRFESIDSATPEEHLHKVEKLVLQKL